MNEKVFVVTKEHEWGRTSVMGVYGSYSTALDEIIKDLDPDNNEDLRSAYFEFLQDCARRRVVGQTMREWLIDILKNDYEIDDYCIHETEVVE